MPLQYGLWHRQRSESVENRAKPAVCPGSPPGTAFWGGAAGLGLGGACSLHSANWPCSDFSCCLLVSLLRPWRIGTAKSWLGRRQPAAASGGLPGAVYRRRGAAPQGAYRRWSSLLQSGVV